MRDWYYRQIRNYSGYGEQILSDDQKELLINIGIQVFLTPKDQKWYEYLKEVIVFHEKDHHFVIPKDYLCADGTKLNFWVMRQKAAYIQGRLREDQIQAIIESGVIEVMDSKTDIGIRHLEMFFQENGHADVPANYVCEDGFRLGRAVRTLRIRKIRANYR